MDLFTFQLLYCIFSVVIIAIYIYIIIKKPKKSLTIDEQLLLLTNALRIMDEKFHDKYSDSIDGAEWIDHCNNDNRTYLINRINDLSLKISKN